MSCLSKWALHPSKHTCMRWMMWCVVTAWCLAATRSHTTPQIWVVTTTSLLFFLLPGLHVGYSSTGLDHFRTQAAEATPGECSSHRRGAAAQERWVEIPRTSYSINVSWNMIMSDLILFIGWKVIRGWWIGERGHLLIMNTINHSHIT